MNYTKAQTYKSLIDIQKKGGQGLGGIIPMRSNQIKEQLDELIEEGLVECFDTKSGKVIENVTYPTAFYFYMPTKGYNVWRDEYENGGSCLNCVRLYLGALEDGKESDDETDAALQLNPTRRMFLRNPEFLEFYIEWLKRNKEELDIMDNLDNVYMPKLLEVTDINVDWIKEKSWYKNNETVEVSLEKSLSAYRKGNSLIDEQRRLLERLIELYSTDSVTNSVKLQEARDELEQIDNDIVTRKVVNNWLEQQNQEEKIQDLV